MTPINILVIPDADVRSDIVPEGGHFEGATMPYWMRLTDSGVGLHVGYVPGRPASHGCIRLKRDSATEIFELVKVGTPVVDRRERTKFDAGAEIGSTMQSKLELLAARISELAGRQRHRLSFKPFARHGDFE